MTHWPVALVLAVAVATPPATPDKETRVVTEWLAAHALELSHVSAGHGFEDLQPLEKWIGDARIVALGEATHGTREFFQLKHRLLEFLVTEMGFTVFGIEATMPEAFDVNEYVLTGKGDAGKALAGLFFWTWDTEEVLEMIEWMRRYNADPRHTRKVKFYGFDMQHATRAVEVVLDYLRRVDPERAGTAASAFAVLANPFTHGDFNRMPAERQASMLVRANDLLRGFVEHEDEWVERTGSADWAIAAQHARILVQNREMRAAKENAGSLRDRSMADNIAWILGHEGPDAKIVVWAHNWHVATVKWGAMEMMGNRLQQQFGPDLVAFGFAFNQGSFQAMGRPGGLQAHHVGPAPQGTLDAALAATGLSLAALDLRKLPETGPVAEWFAEPHAMREMGAGYNEAYAEQAFKNRVVQDWFDVLLFVETTTAARSNPWVKITPRETLPGPANLDFERGAAGEAPPGWRMAGRRVDFDYKVTTTEEGAHRGRRAAMLSRVPGRQYGETFGGLLQRVDATPYRGRQLTVRAAVRTDGSEDTKAYVWVRVITPEGDQWYENMAGRPITAAEWREYEITGPVSPEAEVIAYGIAIVGSGSVWVDSVSLLGECDE